jgi:L-alanine-DL-glutamate epimerase-like enolase superfamily enzyme
MSALAGIDIALWDLKARKLNVPIYQLLGGKVRDKLKVYAWIGGDRPGDVKTQAYVKLFYTIPFKGTCIDSTNISSVKLAGAKALLL